MRFDTPNPGNPWPKDMVIRIDPHSHLLTPLFVRHAWGLARAANIPDLDPEPDIGDSHMPPEASRVEWSRHWERAWDEAWAWFSSDAPVPPHWESEHGSNGIDRAALGRWRIAVRGPLPPPESPEHRCLDALIPAWRSGIENVIVLPYRGYYVNRPSRGHVVVSRTTRDDPELYRRALSVLT